MLMVATTVQVRAPGAGVAPDIIVNSDHLESGKPQIVDPCRVNTRCRLSNGLTQTSENNFDASFYNVAQLAAFSRHRN